MNNKRNKRGPVRTQKHKTIAIDGAYGNTHFLIAAAAQIGNPVRVKTKAEDVYDGILKTFSQQFDVAVEVATLIEENEPPNATGDSSSLVEKLVFHARDIVTLSFTDVDITYAFKDTFQTDSAISSRLNGAGCREEKELEPWDGEMNGNDAPLELDSSANGWDANDMFKKNELEYGVTSTFDHSLRGYTVQLQHSDTPDYKEAEAKANQIASEIESKPSHKARLELENGDEEAVYAAVVRPSEPNGKYIPPAKRKNQKAPRSSPPPTASAAEVVKTGNGAAPAQGTASKGAQTSPPAVQYAPAPTGGVPVQQQQTAPPPPPQQQQQAPMHSQMAVPQQNQQQGAPQQVQQAQHQTRQNHGFANRQKHMNGESNKAPRGPRSVYQAMPPQQQQQQHVYQEMQPNKMVEMNHNGNHGIRHHREEVKDLQQFAQDFTLGPKEAPQQQGPQLQQMPEQVMPQGQQQQPPPSSATASNLKAQPEVSPQPSPSPQSDGPVDKVTAALKKSTLNPNAKEFVLNPSAKPFMPSFNSRTPSASSLSRPHTPQTPSHPQYISTTMNGGPMAQPPTSMIVQMGYMMPGQAQYPQQPQGNRMRKNGHYQLYRHVQVPTGQIRGGECLSQMQVAAATGQPLLAPAPMSPFVYQTGINPTAYHQMHGVRMYDAPPQLQYLPPPPPQASQAGGQPGQPQAPPQQYQPAPPQQYQAAPPPQGGVQTHQYVPMCNLIPPAHLMQGVQYLPPPPPPQHPIPLILHNQQHQVHQGPA